MTQATVQQLQMPSTSQTAVDQLVKQPAASGSHFKDASGDSTSCQTNTSTDHTGTVPEKIEKVQKKKKSNKQKKRSCYGDLAMAIGHELAQLKVQTKESEPINTETEEQVDCADNEFINVRDYPELSAMKLGPLQEGQPPKGCDIQSINSDGESEVSGQYGVDHSLQEVPEEKVKKPVKVAKNKRKGCYVELAENIAPMLQALNIKDKENQDQSAQPIRTSTEVRAPVLQGATAEQQGSPVTTGQQAATLITKDQATTVTSKGQTKPERPYFKEFRRASRRLPQNLEEVSADELDALRTKLQNTLHVLTRDEIDRVDSQDFAVVAPPENDQMGLQMMQQSQSSYLSGEKRIKADTDEGAITKKHKSKKRKGPKKPSCYVQLAADIASDLANLQVKVHKDDIREIKSDAVATDTESSEPFIVVTSVGELKEEMVLGSLDACQEKNQPVNSLETCDNSAGTAANTPIYPGGITAKADDVEQRNTLSSVHDGEVKEQESNDLSVEANVNQSMRSTVVAEAFGDVLTTVC